MGRRGTNKPRFRRVSSSPSFIDFLNGRWGSDTVDSRDASYLVGYKLMLERLAYHPGNEKVLETVLPQLEAAAYELETKVESIIKLDSSSKGFFASRGAEKQIEKIAKFYDELLTLAVSHEKGFEELKHHYQRFHSYINTKITRKNPELARQLLGAYREAYEKIFKARQSVNDKLKTPCANYAEYLHVKRYQESVLKPGQEVLNKQSKAVEEALAKLLPMPIWKSEAHKLSSGEDIIPVQGSTAEIKIDQDAINTAFEKFQAELQGIQTVKDGQPRSAAAIQADAIFIYNQYLGANSVVADFIRNAESYQKYQAQVLGAERLKPATLAFLKEVKKFRDDARKYCGADLLDPKFEEKPFGLAERAYVHRAMAEVQEKVAARLRLKSAGALGKIAKSILDVQKDPPFKKLLTSKFPVGSSDAALQETVANYLAQFLTNAFDANKNITVSSSDVQAAIQQCQREIAAATDVEAIASAYNNCFEARGGQQPSDVQVFIQQVSDYEKSMALDPHLPKLDPAILQLHQQVTAYQDAIKSLYFSRTEAPTSFNQETKVVAAQDSPRVNAASSLLAEEIIKLQVKLAEEAGESAITAYQNAFDTESILGEFIHLVETAKQDLKQGQKITPEVENFYNYLIKFRDGIARYYQVNRPDFSDLSALPNPVSAPEGIDPFKVSKALQILNQEIRNQLAMSASKGTDEEAKLETIQKAINDARADENIKKLLDQTYPSASPDAAYQKEIQDYFASLQQRFTPSAPITQPLGQLAQNEAVKNYQHDADELAKSFKQNMDKLYQDLKESTVSSTEFKKTSEWLVAEHEKQVKVLGEKFESKFDAIAKETAQYGDKSKEAQALFNQSQEALLAQSAQYAQVVKESVKKADEEQKSRERRRLFLIMTRPELFPAADEAARQRIEDEIDRLNDNYLEELDKYNDIRLGPGVQIKMLYTPGNEMDREGHWNPGQYEILVHDDSPESMAALDLAIDLILERKLRSGMARGDLKITLSKIGKNEASAVRLIQRLKARGIPYEITDPRYSAGPKKAALLEKVDAGVKREQIKTETGDYLKALTGVARQQGAKVEANGEIITRYGMKIKVPEIPANVTPNDLFEANKRHESLRATAAVVAAHYPFDGGQDKIMAPFKALQEIDMQLRRKVGVNYQELEKEAGELNRTKPQTPEQVARLNALYAALKDMTDTRTITDESATKDTPRTITDARTEILKELGKNFGTRLANLERMDLRGAGAVGFDKPENVDDYAQILREKMEEYLKLGKAAQLLQDEKNRKVAIQGLNIVAASLLEDVKKLEELCIKAGRDPDKLMNAYLGKSSSELKEGLLTALKVVGRILAAPLLAFSSIAEGLEAFILAAPLLSSLISSPLNKADPDAALSEISANAAARAKQTEEQLARQEMRLKVHGPLLKEIAEKKLDEESNLNDLCQQLHLLAPLAAPVLMTAIHEGKVPAFAALLLTQNPETGVYYASSDGQVLSRAMRLALHKGDEETPGTLAWAKEVYTNAKSDHIKLLLNLEPKIELPEGYQYSDKHSLQENIHNLEKNLAQLKQEKRALEKAHNERGLANAESRRYHEVILPREAFFADTLNKLNMLRSRILLYKLPQATTQGLQAIGDLLTLSQFEAYCEMDDEQQSRLDKVTKASRESFADVQAKQNSATQAGGKSPLQIYRTYLTQEVEKITAHLTKESKALDDLDNDEYHLSVQTSPEEDRRQAITTVYTQALREQLSLQVPTVLDRACHESSGYGPTVETIRLVRKQTLGALLDSKDIGFKQKIFLSLTKDEAEELAQSDKSQAVHFIHSLKSTAEELQKFYQEFNSSLISPEEQSNFRQCFTEVLRERVLNIFQEKAKLLEEEYADSDISQAWGEALSLLDGKQLAPKNFDAEHAAEMVIKADSPLSSLSNLANMFIERLQTIKAINGQIAKQMVANLDAADCDEALANLDNFIEKNIKGACQHVTGAPPQLILQGNDAALHKQSVALKILERSQDQLHYLTGSTKRDSTTPEDVLQQRLSGRLEFQLMRDVNILNITVPYGLDVSFNDAVNFSQSVELLARFVEKLQEIERYYQKLAQELGVDAKSFAPIIAEHVAKQMRSLRTQLDARADAKQPAPEAEKIRDAFEAAGLAKLCVTDTKSTPKEAIIAMVEKAKTLYIFDSPDPLLKQLEQIDILQVRGKRSRGFFQLKKLGDEKIGKDDLIAGMLEFNGIVQSTAKKVQQLIDGNLLYNTPRGQHESQEMKEKVEKYISKQLLRLHSHFFTDVNFKELTSKVSPLLKGNKVSPEQLRVLVAGIQQQLQSAKPVSPSSGYHPLSDSDEPDNIGNSKL
jgi:hypothetical protein